MLEINYILPNILAALNPSGPGEISSTSLSAHSHPWASLEAWSPLPAGCN